jgi:hypothetical protein
MEVDTSKSHLAYAWELLSRNSYTCLPKLILSSNTIVPANGRGRGPKTNKPSKAMPCVRHTHSWVLSVDIFELVAFFLTFSSLQDAVPSHYDIFDGICKRNLSRARALRKKLCTNLPAIRQFFGMSEFSITTAGYEKALPRNVVGGAFLPGL